MKKLSQNIELIVPLKVFREFCDKSERENQEFVRTNFQIIDSEGNEILTRFLEYDSGELFVISQGIQYKINNEEYCCVLDEKLARDIADTFEIQKTGTIGVLRIMYGMKIVSMDKLKNIKSLLLTSDFRIKPEYLIWIK